MVKIINFLLIAGVIQGLGFNLVTIFVKKKYDKVIIFLNLTVLFISLNNLQAWLIDQGYICSLFVIKHLEVPWYLLIFPMFYAFTTNFLRVEKRVNDFIKPSLVIFVLEIIIRLCLISVVYYDPDKEVGLIEKYTSIEEICNVFYCIFLFVNASILVFRKHEMLEYILTYDDLKWIRWFIKLGSVVILFWLIAIIIKNTFGDDTAYYPLRLGTSVLLYWIGYQGFYKYSVVQDRIFLRSTIANNEVLISSSTENDLPESEKEDFINKKHQEEFETIKSHIVNNKLYLNPLLSMETITNELGMSKSHLSKLINSYSQYNFSDFINSLRVAQAKKFLSNDEFSEYTIVAIGLECGFNSKSTFYSAFKKFTSQTPSSFRDQF